MESEKDFGIKKIGPLTDEEIFGAKKKQQLFNIDSALATGMRNPALDLSKDKFSEQLELLKDEKFKERINQITFDFMKGKIKFKESVSDLKWAILLALGAIVGTVVIPPFAIIAVFVFIVSFVKSISSLFKGVLSILSYANAANLAQKIGVNVNGVSWYVIFLSMFVINILCALVAIPFLAANLKNKINNFLSEKGISDIDFDNLFEVYENLKNNKSKENALMALKETIMKRD